MGLKLQAEVGLDGSGFERGLNRLGHAATHNFKSLVVGAFGVYSVHQALEKTVESAEELITTSKRLDVTVEQLQVLRQAAKENGVEFGKLATAFEKIDVAREKALGGGAEGARALAAFGRLGVDKNALQNQTAAQIFMGPMRRGALGSSAENLAGPMKEIFAKGFGELLPVLKTDFEELEGKMKHLGSIMDTESAVAVKHLADEFDLLSNIIIAQAAPALIQFADILVKLVGWIKTSAAFAGGATKDMGWFDALKAILNPVTGALDAIPKLDLKSGSEMAGEQSKSWEDLMADMQKKISEEANRLKNPPKPDFTPEGEKEKAIKRMAPKAGDALVSVGNFLGTAKGSISNLQERQLQIATESRNYLRAIAQRAQRQFIGDSSGAQFPIA